jgi:hypothetical protein
VYRVEKIPKARAGRRTVQVDSSDVDGIKSITLDLAQRLNS